MEQGGCLARVEWGPTPWPMITPTPPRQHITGSQTLQVTVSMVHLFGCTQLSASNSAHLLILYCTSGARSLSTTCLRLPYQRSYWVESTTERHSRRICQVEENRGHHLSCQWQVNGSCEICRAPSGHHPTNSLFQC